MPIMIKILSVVTEILLILTAYNKFQTFCSLTYSDLPSLEGTSPLKTSMKLHDCEAIEIKSVEEVLIGLERVKKALRKYQETNKRFP